jgi:hypothetical protein
MYCGKWEDMKQEKVEQVYELGLGREYGKRNFKEEERGRIKSERLKLV